MKECFVVVDVESKWEDVSSSVLQESMRTIRLSDFLIF